MSRSLSMYPDDMVESLKEEVMALHALKDAAYIVAYECEKEESGLPTPAALSILIDAVDRLRAKEKEGSVDSLKDSECKSGSFCGRACDVLIEERERADMAVKGLYYERRDTRNGVPVKVGGKQLLTKAMIDSVVGSSISSLKVLGEVVMSMSDKEAAQDIWRYKVKDEIEKAYLIGYSHGAGSNANG